MTPSLRSRRNLVVLLGIVALLGLTATLAVGGGQKAGSPVAFAPNIESSSGGNAQVSETSPEELLGRVVDRLGPGSFREKRFGAPPAGFQPTEDPEDPVPSEFTNGLWAYFTVDVPADRAGRLKQRWVTYLAAGALREELHRAGLPPLYSFSAIFRKPNGTTIPGGALGTVAYGQQFSTETEEVIASTLRAKAQQLGLRVRSIDFLAPLQLAPAVVAGTDDPQAYGARRLAIIDALFGGTGTYEGFYLAVEDTRGRTIDVAAWSARAGAGLGWTRPDLPQPPSIPPPLGQ